MSDHNPDITKMIALLRYFNRWRRGVEKPMPAPADIGIAIDAVCDAVAELREDKARLIAALGQTITQLQLIASITDDDGVEETAVESANFAFAAIDAAKGGSGE